MKISWVNKYSGETGFVKSINEDGKDFINASTIEEAGNFTVAVAKKCIADLNENQSQNIYETVDIPKAEKKTTRKPREKKSAEKIKAKRTIKRNTPEIPISEIETINPTTSAITETPKTVSAQP